MGVGNTDGSRHVQDGSQRPDRSMVSQTAGIDRACRQFWVGLGCGRGSALAIVSGLRRRHRCHVEELCGVHPMCTRSFWGVLPGSTSVSILDQSTQRRQLCEARRICWRVLLGTRPCHEGLDCHTKFLGSTPWQRSSAARPWLEHSLAAHPWLGSTPRHPSSKTVTPSTSRPCSVEGWPLGRNSVHYIARRSLHGGLGRHAAALDKKAAWASPLAHVTRSRA